LGYLSLAGKFFVFDRQFYRRFFLAAFFGFVLTAVLVVYTRKRNHFMSANFIVRFSWRTITFPCNIIP